MFLLLLQAWPYNDKPAGKEDPLVAAARNGDDAAFTQLVERHREQVFGIAWKLTHRHEDALDVMQEAFIRMWHALPGYRGKSSFNTWLHRIVLNTGIDYIRRESRHRHISFEMDKPASSEGVPDQAPSREASTPAPQRDQVYETQLNQNVLAALNQLSFRQRQVFVLRYYHGLSLREIAEIIHATEGTVKQHLSRAQVHLREMLRHLQFND